MFGPPPDDYDCCPTCGMGRNCPDHPSPDSGCRDSKCEPDATGVFWHSCRKQGLGKQCIDCPGTKRIRLGMFGEI